MIPGTKTIEREVTLQQWAEMPDAKQRLLEIMSEPAFVMALNIISREIAPTTKVQRLDGVSFLESVAMTNIFRAGADDVIRRLKAMPFVVTRSQQDHLLGRPYEWLGSQDDKDLVKKQKEESQQ